MSHTTHKKDNKKTKNTPARPVGANRCVRPMKTPTAVGNLELPPLRSSLFVERGAIVSRVLTCAGKTVPLSQRGTSNEVAEGVRKQRADTPVCPYNTFRLNFYSNIHFQHGIISIVPCRSVKEVSSSKVSIMRLRHSRRLGSFFRASTSLSRVSSSRSE